jgi:FkbM family methyltransferase
MSMASLFKRIVRGILRRIRSRFPLVASPELANVGAQASPAPTLDQSMVDRYTRRTGFILTDIISNSIGSLERFIILDGGAREALSDQRWQALEPKRVRLYGFEPDAKEVDELNRISAERGLDFRYYASGLWSEPARLTFYENKSPGGGAFFEQNTDLTDRWKFANSEQKFLSKDIFFPTKTSTWEMTSIAKWAKEVEVVDIDFMKLNVQGAELEILKGCDDLLETVIGLMVEVSFVESYKNRPFFADIDSFLRGHGFSFFDLIGHHYMGRARSPITARHAPGLYPLWGQLIEGHGIYFKDPIDLQKRGISTDHFTLVKLLKLVGFAEMFGQNEYAFELLEWLVERQRRLSDTAGVELVNSVLASAESRYRSIMGGWAVLEPK